MVQITFFINEFEKNIIDKVSNKFFAHRSEFLRFAVKYTLLELRDSFFCESFDICNLKTYFHIRTDIIKINDKFFMEIDSKKLKELLK